MKHIFDDIRKEIDIHSDEACFLPDDMMVVSENEMKKIIDEAEARWESEVCEWKVHRYLNVHKTSCGMAIGDYHKAWNFCPYCGKPIKISEVE